MNLHQMCIKTHYFLHFRVNDAVTSVPWPVRVTRWAQSADVIFQLGSKEAPL